MGSGATQRMLQLYTSSEYLGTRMSFQWCCKPHQVGVLALSGTPFWASHKERRSSGGLTPDKPPQTEGQEQGNPFTVARGEKIIKKKKYTKNFSLPFPRYQLVASSLHISSPGTPPVRALQRHPEQRICSTWLCGTCLAECPVLQFSLRTCRWRQTQREPGQSKAKEPRLALQKNGVRYSVYSAASDSSDLSYPVPSHTPTQGGRDIIQLPARNNVAYSRLAIRWTPSFPACAVLCPPFPSAPGSFTPFQPSMSFIQFSALPLPKVFPPPSLLSSS